MPFKKDDSGRRWVEMEFLVPGTPEQVWQAIATGAGMSAWFTTTQIEERVGGAISFDFGDENCGEDISSGKVTGVGSAGARRIRGIRMERRRPAGGDRGDSHRPLRRSLRRPDGAHHGDRQGRLGRRTRELRNRMAGLLRDPQGLPRGLRRSAGGDRAGLCGVTQRRKAGVVDDDRRAEHRSRQRR